MASPCFFPIYHPHPSLLPPPISYSSRFLPPTPVSSPSTLPTPSTHHPFSLPLHSPLSPFPLGYSGRNSSWLESPGLLWSQTKSTDVQEGVSTVKSLVYLSDPIDIPFTLCLIKVYWYACDVYTHVAVTGRNQTLFRCVFWLCYCDWSNITQNFR